MLSTLRAQLIISTALLLCGLLPARSLAGQLRFPVGNLLNGSPYTLSQSFQDVPFTFKGKTYKGHLGEDWAVPQGTDVFPIAQGRVVRSRNFGGDWDHVIIIEHRALVLGRAIYSMYAHLETRLVGEGEIVLDITKPIGRSGIKGTGAHLHFEIKDYGTTDITPGSGYTQQDSVSGNELVFRGMTYFRPTAFLTTTTPLPVFDFAMGFMEVDGNILDKGNPDFVPDFFDNFNDGSLSTLPTAFFFFPQPVQESGGLLRFRSADGARTVSRFGFSFLEDEAILGRTVGGANPHLRNGLGNSQITASFRADTPSAGQFYAIGTVNSGTTLRESVALVVGRGSDGNTYVTVNDHTGTIIAADRVTLPAGGFILLRLFVNDAAKRVVASYSVNNGATFKQDTQFSFFLRQGTIFTQTSDAFIFAQGGVIPPLTSPGDFTIINPFDSALSVIKPPPGLAFFSGPRTIIINPSGGFNQNVILSITSLIDLLGPAPIGITCSLGGSPFGSCTTLSDTLSPSEYGTGSKLRVRVTSDTALSSYNIVIQGQNPSGTIIRTKTIELEVNNPTPG